MTLVGKPAGQTAVVSSTSTNQLSPGGGWFMRSYVLEIFHRMLSYIARSMAAYMHTYTLSPSHTHYVQHFANLSSIGDMDSQRQRGLTASPGRFAYPQA